MPNTTINAYPYPAASDAPNGPLQIQTLALAVDKRSVAVFANDAARDAAIPSPTSGMVCVSGAVLQMHRGGAWAKQGGSPATIYENASSGSSGNVSVGAGQVGVLSVNVPATGVVSDVGTIAVTAGVSSSASGSIGTFRVTASGVTAAVGFNATSTNPVPVAIIIPRITLPAVTFTLSVTLEVASGVAASMGYSSVRVTY